MNIECFLDVDWARSKEDERSTFGYNAIWFCGKVKCKM